MTIKIEDFALGNQQPKNPNESKPNLNQNSTKQNKALIALEALNNEKELGLVVGGFHDVTFQEATISD